MLSGVPLLASADVVRDGMVCVPVTNIVPLLQTVALTFNKNAPMSTLLHISVTQTTMFPTTRRCVNRVRADVVIGVLIVISVIVTVNVEDGTIAVKTSR